MPFDMSSDHDPTVDLYECRGGYLFYERDAGKLHFFNDSGLLVWNLRWEGFGIESIAPALAMKLGRQEPPTAEIQSIEEILRQHGLIATAGGSVRPDTIDEALWPQSRDIVARATGGDVWRTPAVVSFPFDGIKVTSAKCSARWVNLDDNTCYAPTAPPSFEDQ
jgi:hypothetical protein